LKQVCKLELESSYYERCTRSSNGRVWSLSSRTIGRMSEGCSLQTTTTDTQLFQKRRSTRSCPKSFPVGGASRSRTVVKQLTPQPRRKLPPRLRGSRRTLAGSEMKRGPARRNKKLQNQPRDQKVGAGRVKKMTSQPKRKLPPRLRGN